MTILDIVTAEDPLLRTKSHKVVKFDDDLKRLAEDMFETMYDAPGVGLAAPQIGLMQRFIVIGIPAEIDEEGDEIAPAEEYALVNPEIVKAYGEEEMEEGCLSVPGYRGWVKRATSVKVKAQDLDGKPLRIRATGYFAEVLQHEIDHLEGVLFVDRIESADKLYRYDLEPEE